MFLFVSVSSQHCSCSRHYSTWDGNSTTSWEVHIPLLPSLPPSFLSSLSLRMEHAYLTISLTLYSFISLGPTWTVASQVISAQVAERTMTSTIPISVTFTFDTVSAWILHIVFGFMIMHSFTTVCECIRVSLWVLEIYRFVSNLNTVHWLPTGFLKLLSIELAMESGHLMEWRWLVWPTLMELQSSHASLCISQALLCWWM